MDFLFQHGIFKFNLLTNMCLYYNNVNPKENSSFKWWSSATIMLDMGCPFACNYACAIILFDNDQVFHSIHIGILAQELMKLVHALKDSTIYSF